jgi:excisionase family DNA binding protein
VSVEPYVTAQEVGEYLKLTTGVVLDKFQRKELPGRKIGRAVRFKISDVDAWLDQGCPSVEEFSAPAEQCSLTPETIWAIERAETERFYDALRRRNGITPSGGSNYGPEQGK